MSGWSKTEVLKRNGVDDNGTARDGAIAIRFRWLEQNLEDMTKERDDLAARCATYREALALIASPDNEGRDIGYVCGLARDALADGGSQS